MISGLWTEEEAAPSVARVLFHCVVRWRRRLCARPVADPARKVGFANRATTGDESMPKLKNQRAAAKRFRVTAEALQAVFLTSSPQPRRQTPQAEAPPPFRRHDPRARDGCLPHRAAAAELRHHAEEDQAALPVEGRAREAGRQPASTPIWSLARTRSQPRRRAGEVRTERSGRADRRP